MAGFECFIGQLDEEFEPEIIGIATTTPTFAAARMWIVAHLMGFLDDECPSCRDQGRRALVDLVISESREFWLAQVDGFDYRIRPVPRRFVAMREGGER